MGQDAEAELLARCRAGEAAAWDEVFDLHYGPALRFIFQLGNEFTPEDAEEICQDTFLSVIRNIGSFQGESRFQTWLFRIAGNKARDYVERQQAAKRGGGKRPLSLQAEDPETGLRLDPPSTAPGPDLALLNSEQFGLVHEALRRLGGPCQEIVELRYFGDLGYDEISRSLRLNPKTVSSRLSKCLDRLEGIARKLFRGESQPVSRLTSENGIGTSN